MLKNVCYLILLLFVVTACTKKNTDPAPDAATRVAGSYELSRLTITGSGASDVDATLPRTVNVNGAAITQSGLINVTKITETTVGVKAVIKSTGRADSDIDFAVAEVKGTDLYEGAAKIGTADGNSFNIDFTDRGIRYLLTSKKK